LLETFGFSTGAGQPANTFFEGVLAFAGSIVFTALSPESCGAFSGGGVGMSVPFWLRA
jgi:hypothetical protein